MRRQEEGCVGEVVDGPESEPPGVARGSTWSRPSAQLPPSFQGHFAPFPRIISSASPMQVHGGEASAMSAVVRHGVMRSANASLPATRDLLMAGGWSYEPGFLGADTQKVRLSLGRPVA